MSSDFAFTYEPVTHDMFPEGNIQYTDVTVREICKPDVKELIIYTDKLDDGLVTVVHGDCLEEEVLIHCGCTIDYNSETNELSWIKGSVVICDDPDNTESGD